MFQGGSRRLPLTLANPTRVAARVTIDLSEHPVFGVALGKDDWDPDQYMQKPLQVLSRALSTRLSSGQDSCATGSMGLCVQPQSQP